MKTADLRVKSEDQLKQELLQLHKEQFNFRFQKSTAQLENTSRVRIVRRAIAKIKTLLAEIKQGGAAKAAKPAQKSGKKQASKE